jgi:hypothetical protein
MSNLFNQLTELRNNLFGSPTSTGPSPPLSRKSAIELAKTNPLIGKLDDDPFEFTSIAYPRDMSNYQQNGHYMIFYINAQENSKYLYDSTEKIFAGPNGMVHGTIGGMSTKTEAVYENVPDGTIDINPNQTVTKYKKKLTHYKDIITTGGAGRPKFKSELRKGKAFYSEGEGKGVNLSARKQTASSGANDPDGVNLSTTKRITDSIAIYLPPNIQSDYGVQYGAHETGMLGFLAATVGASVGGIKNQNLEKAAQALVGGVEGFTQYALQKALSSAADFLTQSEGGEELFNKAFGRANNPYMEVLFDKPDLREFTYNFTFVPRSEAETNDVNTIIQMFRFHMAPEMRQDHSRFMTLPSEFDLHYMYQDGNGVAAENSYFNKISTCVLKNCSVNYTPDGAVQTHDDGSPVKITMSLTFAETEMITKQKIQEGF